MPHCCCEDCAARIPWRWHGHNASWVELYVEGNPFSIARPVLRSKAAVAQALEAFCDGGTPLEWRVALGLQLVNARLLLERGPEVYKQVKAASKLEKMLKVMRLARR
jgi:hypothetical protein